ncbi:ATP-dependent DNA ligase [Patescibacteria group bacterium]|nr:ATP-dependent DNA ligase [Patescibacteria group bacterium]
MLFKTLCEYLEKLSETPKRLEITAILAELFNSVSVNEIYETAFLSLGTLEPPYQSLQFNLAEKMAMRALSFAYNKEKEVVLKKYKELGDLGKTAEFFSQNKNEGALSILDAHKKLKQIALDEGEGSQERKIQQLSSLIKNMDGLGAKYAIKIVLGTMRLGFSEITLIEALSWMEKEDKSLKKQIEEKYRIYPNIGFIAKKLKEEGIGGIRNINIETGVPILSARCQRVDTAEDIIKRHKISAIENKYDGTRVQIHLDRTRTLFTLGGDSLLKEETPFVKTFTRNLEETTPMFPDVTSAVLNNVNAQTAILDCEAIGMSPKTGEFVSFQITIKRKRKHNVKAMAEEIPLKLIVFDILFYNGESLIHTSFKNRREILKKIIHEDGKIIVAPETIVDTADKLMEVFNRAIEKGLEGIVAKDLNASYTVGSRGYAWIKFKREETGGLEDTLEPIVLGYYKGAGQRAKFGVGAFLVGALDEKSDTFKTIAKIGTGLTDEQWGELKARCDKIKVLEKPKEYIVPKELFCDVWCEPKILTSIRADEITVSPIHTAGYALRFPRLIAFRDDIATKDATTVQELKNLYKLWKK